MLLSFSRHLLLTAVEFSVIVKLILFNYTALKVQCKFHLQF